jgi:zinc protease
MRPLALPSVSALRRLIPRRAGAPLTPTARRQLLAWSIVWAGLWSVAAQAALPIQHWTTSRGARVVFVRADAIPMLDVSIAFDAGERHDPPGRVGLASMVIGMLARGVEGLDESQIADLLADIGAIRGGAADDDRASVSMRTLTSAAERDAAIDLLARLVSRPTFPDALLSRERERSLQALRESLTKPEVIAGRAFYPAVFGDHPYGAQRTPEGLNAITRDDLLRFHQARFGAAQAVIAMVGAITREEAERIAERLVRDLPAGAAASPMPAIAPPRGGEQRLPHPASQSHLLVGSLGIARDDPDFFPFFVGNYILGGGGFVSRLTDEVREKRGLSYSVSSGFSPMAQPGAFVISLQTRKEQTDEALQVVRKTLADFVARGPTPQEMEAARKNLVGGFALRIDSNGKILANLANIAWYRLPLDYLETWTQRIEAVTAEQVRTALARRLQPDQMVTVIVGAGEAR